MRATKNADWRSLQVDSHLLHLIEKKMCANDRAFVELTQLPIK